MTEERSIKEQWIEDKQKELRALILQPGQFYEINGILYRCQKKTKKGFELRRFTGSIHIPKVNATGTMIQNAKEA
ncbi:MAG: hypothetical protein K0S79_108 [Nitrospira sp.]|nr:hypothetical protein [Nitrospira sp.]